MPRFIVPVSTRTTKFTVSPFIVTAGSVTRLVFAWVKVSWFWPMAYPLAADAGANVSCGTRTNLLVIAVDTAPRSNVIAPGARSSTMFRWRLN